ncbi:MAG: hypothetical protein GX249_06330 [Firmicutes bacterium]|nr:hypothetical protein [Bacillota bacterium]
MHDRELTRKVRAAVYNQCQKRGYATPVDVLMDLGVLSKQKYEDWRFGRVDYLERVCTINLRKLSLIMRQIRVYAGEKGLKPSLSVYKQWGRNKGSQMSKPLRFSKSGNADMEKWYATHFVEPKRTKSRA